MGPPGRVENNLFHSFDTFVTASPYHSGRISTVRADVLPPHLALRREMAVAEQSKLGGLRRRYRQEIRRGLQI